MREWYFQVMGQELGPFSAAELKARVESGQIQRDTMIRRGVDGSWIFAERVKGLMPAQAIETPPIMLPSRKKSSASMPVVAADGRKNEDKPGGPDRLAGSNARLIAIPLVEDDATDQAHAPSAEFYDFVGFREAISPVLHRAARQFMRDHDLTMTQLNRRALATYLGRAELASDLMITNIAVIPQPVNAKSNSDGSDPLDEKDRTEQATIRVTLFNCSSTAMDVDAGEFVPESVESRQYDEVGTLSFAPLDHKGHASVTLKDPQPTVTVPFRVRATVPPRAAMNVVVWFRGESKPSVMKLRGAIRLISESTVAISEPFTIVLHADSPS